jgi:hypothetical protein
VSLFHRFRQAVSGVRVARATDPDVPALPTRRPLLALPAPPRRRRSRVEEYPVCEACGTRHEPRPHPADRGGLQAAYSRPLLADPFSTRPEPLNRQANEVPLVRDRFNPWRKP